MNSQLDVGTQLVVDESYLQMLISATMTAIQYIMLKPSVMCSVMRNHFGLVFAIRR